METQPRFSLRRPLSLLLSLVMLCTALAVALPVSAANHKPVDLDQEYGKLVQFAIKGECDYAMAYDVLELVNAERKKVKKPALKMDKSMMESAMQRAAECAVNYSHTRPSGEAWSTVLLNHRGAGENIAAGYTSAADAMEGWMGSPGHKANILDEMNYDFKSIGIGVFQVDGIYYWCQLFNGREKQADPTQKKPVTKTMTVEARLGLTSLAINHRSLNLKDGKTATLQVTNSNLGFAEFVHQVDPSGLTFTASKAGIVTVSKSGVVKPIGNGSTTITVKSKNGVKLFTVSVTAQVENPHTKHSYTTATCTAPKTCKECGATSGKKLGHTYSNDCDKTCNRCKASRTVAGHTYKKVVTKATLAKNGSVKNVCSSCGYTASKTTTLYKASKISLSKTVYTYDGKAQKPAVVVKDSQGKPIASGNYTVTYASGRKNVGTYKVTVKMKGNYSGTKTLTFKINPAKTTIKATAAKKSLKLTIGKKTTQVTGYEVQYATSKSFKSYKSKLLSGYSKTSLTLSGLKAKTTYYVRVRTYKTVNGVKYYSGWSTVISKKTK